MARRPLPSLTAATQALEWGWLGRGVGPGWEGLDTSPDQPVGLPPGQGDSMPPLLGTVSARLLFQASGQSCGPLTSLYPLSRKANGVPA